MKRILVMVVCGAVSLGACGGGDSDAESADEPADTGSGQGDDDASAGGDDDGASNDVVDAPPAGRATASVDGREIEFDVFGFGECTITDDTITYSFLIADENITLGAGANRVDGGWMGSIALNLAEPDGEPGPIAYYPAPGENGISDGSYWAVDGSSMSYSGPMLKQPPNDGSNPPPIDVGNGTVSATCD